MFDTISAAWQVGPGLLEGGPPRSSPVDGTAPGGGSGDSLHLTCLPGNKMVGTVKGGCRDQRWTSMHLAQLPSPHRQAPWHGLPACPWPLLILPP